MKPKISVVMPVWNGSRTIANAIESIRNQTMEDFELIIVDDGSIDFSLTRDIVRKFKDERIWLFSREHEGLVSARNYGNSLATADVIATMDADDLSLPNRLECCYQEIKKGADIVCHDAMTNFWDAQFQCISRGYIKNPPFNKYKLLQGQCYTGWPIFRKKVWEKKPFRLETQFQYDWSMLLDWAFSGYTFKIINEILYEYIRHENSASQLFEKDGRRKESYEAIKNMMKDEYNQCIK